MHNSTGIIISILMLCVIAGIALHAYLPIRRSLAVSKVIQHDAVPYEQHPPHPSMYVLVTGDSTAVGTGALEPKLSTAGLLGSQFPTADITNVSQNGLKLEGLEVKLAALPRDRYDLILMQIGANDAVGFTPQNKIAAELDSVLARAEQLSPRTVLITSGDIGLAPVFKWPLSEIMDARTRTVRKIFIAEAAKYPTVHYVDLFKEAKNEPFTTNIPKYYAADLFHPTAAGYALWYQQFAPALAGK
jgi:lysophospholipase L1-like esterase